VNAADTLVLIRGAGDLASGVAARLHRSGFPVVMTELPAPLLVRRTVCFGEAVWDGATTVEGITARLFPDADAALAALAMPSTDRFIPVLVDPEATSRPALAPRVLIDARMTKGAPRHETARRAESSITDAPLVLALGPGFTARVDCHAVIETHRGHMLGRVYWQGSALPNTGVPGEVGGESANRVLRAPVDGVLTGRASIADRVEEGQIVATVNGVPIHAGCAGVLRGLIRDGVQAAAGMKVGDIDPRAEPEHCYLISDKSLAVAGGVLEAILCAFQ
jgi:xanthine dehydrogenase accessory factor